MTVNCEAYVRQPKFCMLKGLTSVRPKVVECDMT